MRRAVLSLAGLLVIQVTCSCAKRGIEAPQPGSKPVAEAAPAESVDPAADHVSRLAPPEARKAAESAAKAEPGKRPAEWADCSWNLRAVAGALFKYMEDHGDKLPEAKSAEELWKLIATYLEAEGSPSVTCPETGEPYLYNTALGGKDRHSVRLEVVLRDSKPHADGEMAAELANFTSSSAKPDDPRFAKGTFR